MFQSNLVQSVAHYPLSKLIPDSIVNSDDESLFGYIEDNMGQCNIFWGDVSFSLMEPKQFRKHLMIALDAGNFNLAAPEIEDLLMTLETLMLRDIHISLGE